MTDDLNIITTRYRVVTPMFLSGADQSKAELRLPSFKGALRFWWRALAWQRFGDNITALKNAENELFGSTHTGQSRVRMRLSGTPVETESQHKFPRNSWQSYIGFGLIDEPNQTSREYIKPGLEFTVQLSCQRCSDEQSEQVVQALMLLGLAGGLGGRSRKAWGSVTLMSLRRNQLDWRAPREPKPLREEISRIMSGSQASLPEWTAFTEISQAQLGEIQNSSEAAHRWLSQKYMATVKDIKPVSKREAFGLPRKNAGRNASERRASPVFLHVHQVAADGDAIPVALYLPAAFLEQQKVPSGGWEPTQNFMQEIAK